MLEGGRDEGERNIGVHGVDGRDVVMRIAHGTLNWGGTVISPAREKCIESALVRGEGAEDIILDEVQEMIGREREDDGRGGLGCLGIDWGRGR